MSQSGGQIILLIQLVVVLLVIVSLWKVYSKAGQPGWGAIIPIYNMYLWLKIAGKPGWWLILLFIPVVNIVFGFIAAFAFAEAFGKGIGFGLGLIFLGVIFLPILAFGDAKYIGPAQP